MKGGRVIGRGEMHHHREYMDATAASADSLFHLRVKTGLNLLLDL